MQRESQECIWDPGEKPEGKLGRNRYKVGWILMKQDEVIPTCSMKGTVAISVLS
jgi:hypothetical protein